MRRLRQAGFDNLSLDLIAGLAPEALPDDLRRAVDLAPDHVSVYLLEIDADEVGAPTALARQVAQGGWAAPDPDWFADAYRLVTRRLRAAGLHRYEVCNFSRRGRQSRHNLKYWEGDPVLGFGPSAHSFWGGERFWVRADLQGYLSAIESGGAPPLNRDEAGPEDRAAERLFLGLRLERGIDPEEMRRTAGGDSARRHAAVLAEMLAAGLLRRRGRRLRLTERGLLVSNEIFQRFLP